MSEVAEELSFTQNIHKMDTDERTRFRAYLFIKQLGICPICKQKMELSKVGMKRAGKNFASFEHILDDWASQYNEKSGDLSNIAVSCVKCNNERGIIRNRIARKFYAHAAKKKGLDIHSANVQSTRLFKLFGPVPAGLFPSEEWRT
jgi:hypothetical protein